MTECGFTLKRGPAAAELRAQVRGILTKRPHTTSDNRQSTCAWMHVAHHLAGLLHRHTKSLRSCTATHIQMLVDTADIWKAMIMEFLHDEGQHIHTKEYNKVIPPYARTCWTPTQDKSPRTTCMSGLKMAYFRWC